MTGPIIVAVDPNEPAEARDALALGAQLAAGYGAPLRAVTVCPEDAELPVQEAALTALVEGAGVAAETAAIPGGSPARRLHELCDRVRPTALVIGSGRPSPDGGVRLGEIAEPLLHGGGAPIAIAVRGYADRAPSLTTIGVGLGGTPESLAALGHAGQLASACGATLKPLVVPEAGLEPLPRAGDAEPTILDGDPATALAAASSHLDLLVVGSRSYGPLRAVLLGAVTRRLIPTSSCAVMVVPRVPDLAHEGALVGGLDPGTIA